jgi:hypothetical protein
MSAHRLARPVHADRPAAPGRHRAPRQPLAARVAAGLPVPAPVLGGVAAGALGAAGSVLLPATAYAAGGDTVRPHRDAALVQVPVGAPYAAPTDGELSRLRGCEAGGSYGIATGNGFYGAYQFDLGTWRGLGLGGYPHQASPDLQDAAAAALEQSRGWRPWPACSARLGLQTRAAGSTADDAGSTGGDVTLTAASGPATPVIVGPAHVARAAPPRTSSAVPAFAGHVLSTADVGTYRADVRLWQERMAQRGWRIAADGRFGPQSARVAKLFAAEKGLSEGLPGEVGRGVWTAAWTAPVS